MRGPFCHSANDRSVARVDYAFPFAYMGETQRCEAWRTAGDKLQPIDCARHRNHRFAVAKVDLEFLR
eukprot:3256077-Lingulodinium_polyedra.AAC.1